MMPEKCKISSINFEYNFHGFLQRSSIANLRLRFPLPSIISQKTELYEHGFKRSRFLICIGGFRSVLSVFVVVYHLPQIPGNSGRDVNSKRFFWFVPLEIPGQTEILKRQSRFPDWDVPNGNSFTIYKFLEFRTGFML